MGKYSLETIPNAAQPCAQPTADSTSEELDCGRDGLGERNGWDQQDGKRAHPLGGKSMVQY
jgi:hypothetical protein